MRTARLLAVAVLTVAAAGGCSTDDRPTATLAPGGGIDSTSDGPATTTASTVASDPVASTAPPSALRFSAPLVGGGEIDLTGFPDRSIALWFWAPG